jgi:ABC-type Fe3+ transport system substrate-binding protein
VVTGEVPLALTAYAYKVEQLRKSGAPIDWLLIPPGVARFEGAGVTRRAAHPHAAILFFEFMLTDGQDILLERDFFPRAGKRKIAAAGRSCARSRSRQSARCEWEMEQIFPRRRRQPALSMRMRAGSGGAGAASTASATAAFAPDVAACRAR